MDQIRKKIYDQLEMVALDYTFQFIDNCGINSTGLNNGKLHLNAMAHCYSRFHLLDFYGRSLLRTDFQRVENRIFG